MRWLVALSALLLATLCQAGVISGRVVRVADGDTITVLDANKVQHKVRLAGIDAPERTQSYGERSRESLDELVAGKTVIVETHKKDRYGRLVGKVLVDGHDVNIEQVRRGMAWFYREYSHEQPATDRQSYDQAEIEAKDFRKGLWADKSPVPPWEFRQKNRVR
jgi:endonuclease YncB( thermonuclease family)